MYEKRKSWSKTDDLRLRQLVSTERYTYREIGELMGRSRNSVFVRAQNVLGLKNPAYQNRITKHAHLREPVMRYFLTHTLEETRKHFGLTASEIKSLFTVGYKDPKLAHLRKDKRRKDAWTSDELVFLARHSGVISRSDIAKKLKRGTMQSVKEAVSRFHGNTRYLNGLPERLARIISPEVVGIKTRAGAPGPNGNCHIKQVPWVVLEESLKWRRGISEEIKIGIKALADFQRFIHGTRDTKVIVNRIKHIAKR